jgi:hypothetical protein
VLHLFAFVQTLKKIFCDEELAILVETLKGFAELVDVGGRDGITAHDIAEIQKRRQAYDDRSRDMSCDSTEVYLCDIATE